ncbi:hypothetical protein BC941DRAFT_420814 [Chlamydoabsidia padenii]|nr:hypothetical protein BC941DRAFT_420814 [Chlamydoabsidia padenii]
MLLHNHQNQLKVCRILIELLKHTNPISLATFWSRVSSFPLVQDGLDKAHHYANQTAISRYALQQAETTLNKASEMANTSYTEQYLKKADALGCRSLDILEQRFPAVTQPTDELVQAVRQSPQQLVTSVSTPVNRGMLTAAGNIETLVDKWLPSPTGEQAINRKEEEEALARFYQLANHIKDRLEQHVHQQIEHIPRTKAEMARLTETNQLLQDTVHHIQTINLQLQDWVIHSRTLAEQRVQGIRDNIKSGYEATQSTTHQRIHELTIELFHRLDLTSNYLKERSVKLPDFIQTRLEPLAEFAGHEYDIIRMEVLKNDIAPLQKATNILQLSHAYILPFLQSSVDGIQEQLHYYSDYAQASIKTGFTSPAPATSDPTESTPIKA